MKILVLGAGGIVGQYLRLYEPSNVEVIYSRREPWGFYTPLTIYDSSDVNRALAEIQPDVIVNLAGENRPDTVERHPLRYQYINEHLPVDLGLWCDANNAHLIHVSTQGVFDGNEAPYPAIPPGIVSGTPVNAYGRQKLAAERLLADRCGNWTIARLTFVVGVRPLPNVGRENPFESMLRQLTTSFPQKQVNDRFFSPSFAHDAAKALWSLVDRAASKPLPTTFNLGTPVRVSRFELAKCMPVWGTGAHPTPPIYPASHSEFPGLAERPKDTTYAEGSLHLSTLSDGIAQALTDAHRDRSDDRAVELAMFFGGGFDRAKQRLDQGFGPNHVAVAADWRKSDPKTDDEILQWYKQTNSYCWELSAYHADPGFNYSGMCRGIAVHLKNSEPLHVGELAKSVLCLGDGIGDLSITIAEHGMLAIYHDLADSVTSQFAQFRIDRRRRSGFNRGQVMPHLTSSWTPRFDTEVVDAVVALDFFEHLPNVEEWARAVYAALRPGGWFLAQNAFGIGDNEHEGSIPMHLVVNNQYVAGWTPLLARLGFIQGQGWWRKP